ncbi:hypothetical protein B0T24DRAFT_629675 [Lasiosphaeria ovina]|uniref:Uncharacterized protein n=1 Tax=Lasiosphaeria ovina TaxID=92902 RepID=A0AAE0K8Z2_9PEZI|nr:hypothetical protein B0T24DRAFT_629675 [Lasiosphaeria ovina]
MAHNDRRTNRAASPDAAAQKDAPETENLDREESPRPQLPPAPTTPRPEPSRSLLRPLQPPRQSPRLALWAMKLYSSYWKSMAVGSTLRYGSSDFAQRIWRSKMNSTRFFTRHPANSSRPSSNPTTAFDNPSSPTTTVATAASSPPRTATTSCARSDPRRWPKVSLSILIEKRGGLGELRTFKNNGVQFLTDTIVNPQVIGLDGQQLAEERGQAALLMPTEGRSPDDSPQRGEEGIGVNSFTEAVLRQMAPQGNRSQTVSEPQREPNTREARCESNSTNQSRIVESRPESAATRLSPDPAQSAKALSPLQLLANVAGRSQSATRSRILSLSIVPGKPHNTRCPTRHRPDQAWRDLKSRGRSQCVHTCAIGWDVDEDTVLFTI